MSADLIVVGSGAGGLTAATVAALHGLDVVLLEATEYFGGTTACSGGGVWVPANRYQKSLGIDDDFVMAERYVKAILGDEYNAEKLSAYIHKATEMLDYMEDNTELKLTATNFPDYEPSEPGHNIGRCLLTAEYSGTLLGPLFDKLRPPIPEMGLFGSMQLNPADAVAMQREGEQLLRASNNGHRRILLTPTGKMMTSPGLATFLHRQAAEYGRFAFLIGGPIGFSPDVIAAARIGKAQGRGAANGVEVQPRSRLPTKWLASCFLSSFTGHVPSSTAKNTTSNDNAYLSAPRMTTTYSPRGLFSSK